MTMHDDDESLELPSKSQRKRDMHALFDLGASMLELSPGQLDKLPLDDALREAVDTCKNIKQHGARKRQLKLISKLMRDADAEAIRNGIESFKAPQREALAELHAIETWRDRLVNDGDPILTEFITAYPHADRQQLRQILRNARQEKSPERSKKAKRELFQVIRTLISDAPPQ